MLKILHTLASILADTSFILSLEGGRHVKVVTKAIPKYQQLLLSLINNCTSAVTSTTLLANFKFLMTTRHN